MEDKLTLWVKYSGQKWGTGEGGYHVDSVEDAVNMIIEKFKADNLVYYIGTGRANERKIVVSSRKLKSLVKQKYGGKFGKEILY